MNQIKKNKKRIEMDCLKCKAKFDAWVISANFDSDVEGRVRKRLYQYCAVCRSLEQSKKGRSEEA